MSERCEAVGDITGHCPADADGQFTRSCVHEHIRLMWLCTRHVAKAGMGRCRDCSRLPEESAHNCPVTLTPAGATT